MNVLIPSNPSISLVISLVSRIRVRVCTDNLLLFLDGSEQASIDLSKATKLKDVVLQSKSWSVEWITTALRTITPKHRDLRQISIHVSYDPTTAGAGANVWQTIGPIREQWLVLDRLLVQFWESRSIRPRATCATWTGGEQDTKDCVRCLLPETTRRGMVEIDLVER